jgi:putative acetyltransferase
MHPATVIEGDLADPRVAELLRVHIASAAAASCRCYDGHALDASNLDSPDVSFWTIWDEDRLACIGALRELAADHGEVKSMHTAEALRGSGFGSAMLRHILAVARARGYRRVSLETGTSDYFRPARTMYQRHGFAECEPFGDYPRDQNSLFLTLEL